MWLLRKVDIERSIVCRGNKIYGSCHGHSKQRRFFGVDTVAWLQYRCKSNDSKQLIRRWFYMHFISFVHSCSSSVDGLFIAMHLELFDCSKWNSNRMKLRFGYTLTDLQHPFRCRCWMVFFVCVWFWWHFTVLCFCIAYIFHWQLYWPFYTVNNVLRCLWFYESATKALLKLDLLNVCHSNACWITEPISMTCYFVVIWFGSFSKREKKNKIWTIDKKKKKNVPLILKCRAFERYVA